MKLLFEIGTEEMPAGAIVPSLAFLAEELARRAAAERLEHGPIERFATPRRLALRVSDVAERTPDVEETRIGPAVSIAFGPDGNPTRAAQGFARGQGVSVEDLLRVDTDKGERVAAKRTEPGRAAKAVLSELLTALIPAIPWPKPMRWGWSDEDWGRPVHWLVALLNEEVVPVSFADVSSGRTSYGHRFQHPGPVEVAAPGEYEHTLRAARVWVDHAERRAEIERRIAAVAAPHRAVPDEGLLDEVTQLVEQPIVAAGEFAPDFLALPREVLISEMREHQRYFAVEGDDGRLVNRFIVVYNTEVRDEATVVNGNRRVLAARLSDGRFFLERDQSKPLADRVVDLERVVFLKGLGSIRDKVIRIEQLAAKLAEALYPEEADAARRAALLCKADLTTDMVGEFPELQGIMGQYYARHDGEDEAVAVAIAEHYRPRGASDEPPVTPAGIAVSMADKIDTLAGCFALGLIPTGSADPYGLRRAALGVLRTVLEHELLLSLDEIVRFALEQVSEAIVSGGGAAVDVASTARAIEAFVKSRLKGLLLLDEGVTPDVVEAVLATGLDDACAVAGKVRALASMRQREDFGPLAAAFKRVTNILKSQDALDRPVDAERFEEDAERELWAAYGEVSGGLRDQIEARDYAGAALTLIELKQPVDRFFDDVLVMSDDEAVRNNRLAMLGELRGLFEQMADISRIQVDS